jgi:hypothetical protein
MVLASAGVPNLPCCAKVVPDRKKAEHRSAETAVIAERRFMIFLPVVALKGDALRMRAHLCGKAQMALHNKIDWFSEVPQCDVAH